MLGIMILLVFSFCDAPLPQMPIGESQDSAQYGSKPLTVTATREPTDVAGRASSYLLAKNHAKGALLDAAKENFSSALAQLDKVGQRLIRKTSAHQTFSKKLPKPPPSVLMAGLDVELRTLSSLIKTNNSIGAVVTVANRLANGELLATTFSEISQHLASLDQGLQKLQETLEVHRAQRQTFKVQLNQIVDTLAASGDTSMLAVKTELDPKMLDADLQQQRTIILSVMVALDALK